MNLAETTLPEQFYDFIAESTGLSVRRENRAAFARSLRKRALIIKFEDMDRYLNFLIAGNEESAEEWQEVISLITTGETYFFRDRGHFSLLKNVILPELMRIKQRERVLRIWSAGCATGEEPYSLAMLLDMMRIDPANWEVSILGTDINERSLAKARGGLYGEWSFRRLNEDVRSKYFTRCKDQWEVAGRIKRMVKFVRGNIVDERFNPSQNIGLFDLIVCRNVLIYFTEKSLVKVLGKFASLLAEGGYLITGHGETQGMGLPRMKKMMYPDALVYRKVDSADEDRSQSGICGEAQEKRKKAERSRPTIVSAPRAKGERSRSQFLWTEGVRQSNSLTPGQERKAAKEAAVQPEDTQDLCLLAQTCADTGKYEEAEAHCRRALKKNYAVPAAYFLLAQVEEARGREENAKGYYKKAIYIDFSFVPAYIDLACLYEKEGDFTRAAKMRSAALELLQGRNAENRIDPYDITAGELRNYLQSIADADLSLDM